MPSLKVIRKRIASTKATQKITRAMKMVAGAKLTRAQQRIVAMRPYAVKTGEVLQSVARTMGTAAADSGSEPVHPLLARARGEDGARPRAVRRPRPVRRASTRTSTRPPSACGVDKKAASVDVRFVTLGRKGREYLARRSAEVMRDFPRVYDGLDMEKARLVARWVVARFEKGEVDSVYLVYNEFKSAITQKVTLEPLLPLSPLASGAGQPASAGRAHRSQRLPLRARTSGRCSSGSCRCTSRSASTAPCSRARRASSARR